MSALTTPFLRLEGQSRNLSWPLFLQFKFLGKFMLLDLGLLRRMAMKATTAQPDATFQFVEHAT